MSNTEFFQERAESFEQARRRLESPRERARVKGSLSDTGSLTTRPAAAAPVLAPRTITWGSAFKISMAVYFALIGVLVTVALLAVLGLRLLADRSTLDGITVQWQPVTGSSSVTPSPDLPDAAGPGTT